MFKIKLKNKKASLKCEAVHRTVQISNFMAEDYLKIVEFKREFEILLIPKE